MSQSSGETTMIKYWKKLAIIFMLAGGFSVLLLGAHVWLVKRDLDPAYQAQSAFPIIRALNAFKEKNGLYPKTPTELSRYLPADIVAVEVASDESGAIRVAGFGRSGIRGVVWSYLPDRSLKNYELDRQIRDGIVSYQTRDGNEAWYWNNNDGSDDPSKEN